MSWQALTEPGKLSPLALAAFRDAHNQALAFSDSVDGYLSEGSLHLDDSVLGLRYAFGIAPFGDDLSADDVRTLSLKMPVGDEIVSFAEGYWSAVKFVEVCQRFGLGIRFSY